MAFHLYWVEPDHHSLLLAHQIQHFSDCYIPQKKNETSNAANSYESSFCFGFHSPDYRSI
jgi:hypothetical protein